MKWLPYQWRYLDDRAPQRVVVKSRRVGFSAVAAFRHAARAVGLVFRSNGAVEHCTPTNQNLLSSSLGKSEELLNKVHFHLDALITGIPGLPRITKKRDGKIKLSNGVEITALSTNPSTGRGGEGDLLLDEWAHVPNQKEVWDAVSPMAGPTPSNPNGYEIDVVSTPFGDDDLFHSMCEGDLASAFSKHRITIHQAIADGFKISPKKLASMRAMRDLDSWLQEYECEFLSAKARYISAEAYDACVFHAKDADYQALQLQRLGRAYAGIDVGKERDLTAIVRVRHDTQGVAWHDSTAVFEPQRGKIVLWDDIEQWIDERVHDVSTFSVDATGMGDQFAQRIALKYPGRAEEVDFTPASKEAMATTLKLAIERRRVRLNAEDEDLRREVLSIRREVTQHGNIKFSAKREKGSHGDRAWALALALRASGTATRSAPRPILPIAPHLRRPVPPWREIRARRGAWR